MHKTTPGSGSFSGCAGNISRALRYYFAACSQNILVYIAISCYRMSWILFKRSECGETVGRRICYMFLPQFRYTVNLLTPVSNLRHPFPASCTYAHIHFHVSSNGSTTSRTPPNPLPTINTSNNSTHLPTKPRSSNSRQQICRLSGRPPSCVCCVHSTHPPGVLLLPLRINPTLPHRGDYHITAHCKHHTPYRSHIRTLSSPARARPIPPTTTCKRIRGRNPHNLRLSRANSYLFSLVCFILSHQH